MDTNYIDVTGLTPEQVAEIKEMIKSFRESSPQVLEENSYHENTDNQLESTVESSKDEELKNLHEEFSLLLADLGVKTPLTRSQIYGS
ncbi:hypothetical protein [Crocosphaera sp. Alani8]|uniref:hypothetical protein n=1 Tax=Crocosphaera sp. Alani8 TaxID=3038952 RepID=UPI00313A96B4